MHASDIVEAVVRTIQSNPGNNLVDRYKDTCRILTFERELETFNDAFERKGKFRPDTVIHVHQTPGQVYDTGCTRSWKQSRQRKLPPIEETMDAERWDVHGNVHPLRHNLLGDPYASAGKLIDRMRQTSALQVYQRYQPILTQDLATRDKRRIQALNRKRAARPSVVASTHHLESRFDQYFRSSPSLPQL